MDKRKWKKLSKRSACALALAMLMSVNPAWADVKFELKEENGQQILYGNAENISDGILGNIEDHKEGEDIFTYDGVTYDMREYDKIVLNSTNAYGIRAYSRRYDLDNVDMEINIDGTTKNTDAIHLTNWEPYLHVNNLKITVNSPTSDAINLSHDSTSPSVIVHGNLTAVVDKGNGIRANAAGRDDALDRGQVASITVHGDTDITLNDNGNQTAKTAAVYAGDSQRYFSFFCDDWSGDRGQSIY